MSTNSYYRNERKTISKTIIKSIRQWLIILLIACFTAMAGFVYANESYKPLYKTDSILVITDNSTSDNVIDNLTSTKELTIAFNNIINSEEMSDFICSTMNVTELPGEISATIIEGTNYITLKTYANTPKLAHILYEKIIESYPRFIETTMENATITIFEKPIVPTEPCNSKGLVKFSILGFVAGILLSVGFIFIKEYLNSTTICKSMIKREFDINAITSIKPINLNDFSYRDFGFETRKIASYIKSNQFKNGSNVILFTSPNKLDAAESVPVPFIISQELAKSNHKTLIIDLDLENQSVYNIVGQKFDAQLSDYLFGYAKINNIINRIDDNLYCIADCEKPESITTFLNTDKVFNMIEKLKSEFDFIIIDTPAILSKTDACEIAEKSDLLIMVADAEYTTIEDMSAACDLLKKFNIKASTCVLNNDSSNNFRLKDFFTKPKYWFNKRYRMEA